MSGAERDARALRAAQAMLAHLHPREDAAARMEQLLAHFGSADALLRSEPGALERLGLRADDALLLSRLCELSRCMECVRFEGRPRLDRLESASEYLIAQYHGLRVERFYLLCLDERGRLLERVLLQEGTADGALFSLRRLLSEAIRTGAYALVISHNHPGLTLRPSAEDLACTRDALRALTAVGIPLMDHIIVAGRQAVSLRQNGFLPAPLWLDQSPGNRLLPLWLRDAEDKA